MEILFYIFSALTLLCGALVVFNPFSRNPVTSAMFLVLTIICMSGLFVLLKAFFLAAVQILVYIGAVGILLLFAIMLTECVTGDDGRRVTARGGFWGLAAAVAVFVFLLLPAIQEADLPESTQSIQPSVKALGHKLMDPYVVTLEVLALLLTAALVGAIATSQGAKAKEEEESE